MNSNNNIDSNSSSRSSSSSSEPFLWAESMIAQIERWQMDKIEKSAIY